MRPLSRAFLLPLLCIGGLFPLEGQAQPNILWLSAEDMGPLLGCYGDPHAHTPELDALAAEGLRYSRAFSTAGVCAPSRSTIITGMYANSIGTHHMRGEATLPGWLKPFPLYLREAGYYCTNNSKTDYQFSKPSPAEIWDDSSAKAHWRNRPPGKPFFAVFNFTGTHESAIADEAKYREITQGLPDAQRQDPAALTTLPPYYPDRPEVREEWKRHYELISAMDAWVGRILKELKESGEWENTLVMFWSDHGVGLPRAKRWLYDSGTRIPLIVRYPESLRQAFALGAPGAVEDRLVSTVDFAPTLLSIAGVPVPEHFQGQSFLEETRRSLAFAARDRIDERHDLIRSVRDARYRYIRNFEPLKPYAQFLNSEKSATTEAIRAAQKEGPLTGPAAWFAAPRKPTEELYDLQEDPHETRNLAADPAQAEVLKRLRDALTAWQVEIGDLGLVPESEIARREPGAGSAFAILRSHNLAEQVKELLAAVPLASAGAGGMEKMLSALGHKEAAVRYWAARGLGNYPAESKELAGSAAALSDALEDKSPAVAIAAARALCLLGLTSKGFAALEAQLNSENPWARLEAALVLDELEEEARPLLPAMKAGLAATQPNKYITRVLNKAVNDLEGTANTVP